MHPKLAAGVAVPQEGLETGPAVFVIPEPSRKRVVNEVMEDASDAVENASGDVSSDIEVDDPMDVSILNTPVASSANTSVLGDEVDVGVPSGVLAIATVSHPACDENTLPSHCFGLELQNAHNLIFKLEAEALAAAKLRKELEVRIETLERDKEQIRDAGERKYLEFCAKSTETLKQFWVGGVYWRQLFMEKASIDIQQANSFADVIAYGRHQGELYERAVLENANNAKCACI